MKSRFAAVSVVLVVFCSCSDRDPPRARAHAAPAAPIVATPFDLGRIIDQVHFAWRRDGAGFSAGHSTHRARVDGDVLELTPRHFTEAAVEGLPVRFGRAELRGAYAATAPVHTNVGARGELLRDLGNGVVEVLANSAEGVEQSWRFERRPGQASALEVRVPVLAGRYVAATSGGLHFDAGALMVRYGHGTWVDATGRATAVPARFEHGAVVLRVPGEVLARSAFPAVLDPVIGPELSVNAPVSGPAGGDQRRPSVAWGGSQYLVVWQDNRGGVPYEIFGARVSAAGTVLDPAGLIISAATDAQITPAVASDGTDFLVAWDDQRAGSSNRDILGARVTAAGAVLDAAGISICSATNSQIAPTVAWNGTNYFVAWEDWRALTVSDIYGTRVSTAGMVLDGTGIAISSAANNQFAPSVTRNGTDLFVAWQDGRAGGTAYDIYGARVNAMGTVLDAAGIAISTATSAQTAPSVASDGANTLVVWQDQRGATIDVYGARVNAMGAVQDPSGIVVSNAASSQLAPDVIWDGTNFVVAWRDVRSGIGDVYGARVSAAGVVQDAAGIAISTAASEQSDVSLASNGSSSLVTWTDARGSTVDVYGARIDATGIVQDTAGIALATSANQQAFPSVAWDGANYLVVWSDNRNGNSDIFGARVTPAGVALDVSGLAISTAPANQTNPVVAWSGTTYLVVWTDSRNTSTLSDVYAARVTAAGALPDPSGIAVSTEAQIQGAPAVASDGNDFFVVWQDARAGSGGSDIYGARVSATGVVQDPTGIAINAAAGSQTAPAIAWGGGTYLVAWQATDLFGARVSATGAVQDTGNGIAISTAANQQTEPAIASDGTGFFVAWKDTRGATADVYGARVTAGGAVQESLGILLSGATGDQSAPAVAWDGTNYLVAWEDLRNATDADVYAARISVAGTVLDATGIPLSTGPVSDRFPAIAARGNRDALVVWQGTDVSAQRVRGRMVIFDTPPAAMDQPVAVTEDTAQPITLVATDADGDPLTFTIETQPAHGTLSGSGAAVTYTPVAEYNGPDSFTFKVNDGTLDSATATVSITVAAVNDPPGFDVLADVMVIEDAASTDVTLTGLVPGGGADEAAQTFVVTATSSQPALVPDPVVSGSGTSRTITVAPFPDAAGVATITVTAQDSGGAPTSRTFDVVITPVNDAPIFDAIADQQVPSGFETYPVTITGLGPGGGADEATQTLAVTAKSSDPSIVADPAITGEGPVRTLTFVPATSSASGTVTVTVTVEDSGGTAQGGVDKKTQQFNLEVTPRGPDSIKRVYYGWQWGTGCGCSGSGGGPLGLAVLFVALLRRRRSSRKLGVAAVIAGALAVVLAPGRALADEKLEVRAAAAPAKRLKLAFMGVTPGAGVTADTANSVSRFVQAQLVGLDAYDVVGKDDISAMLGVERMKQLLGCADESECMAEISGALNSERAISGDLSRVGDTTLFSLSLIDLKSSKPLARVARRIEGSGAEDRVLDAVGPAVFELVSADPALTGRKLKYERPFGGFAVGVRGEIELVGRSAAPVVMAEYSGKWWAAVAAVAIGPTPGFRAEGRFCVWGLGRVRPYVGLGATLFFPAVGLRAATGAEVRFGPVHVFADAAFERFVNSDASHNPNAVLLSLGASWLF